MNTAMAHRGPDDHGVYTSPDGLASLGNRRLAIIDLSAAGHMPMANEDASVVISYNGEIYNFVELREELLAQGYRFKSNSDTEVVLRLYERDGEAAFARLNGMFAAAIWDVREQKLVLARDQMGIKPVYYHQSGNRLLFASEIKCLLESDLVTVTVDPAALHYFLTFLWVPGPKTLFRGIFKLMPGELLVWKGGRVTRRYFADIPLDQPISSATERELVSELRSVLRNAVRRQMVSDVPVGVFLSGGLDSTAILALASEATGKPVNAYTIAYRQEDARLEQSADDRFYARRAAKHFSANYHEIEVQPDVTDLLAKVVWHLDEPVADPAAITSLLICQAARPEVTVLLSGQGGDEVFAGYRVHLMDRLARQAALVPGPLRRHGLMPALAMLPRIKDHLPGISPGKALAVHRYADKLLRGVDLPRDERYVFYRSYYQHRQLMTLYADEMRASVADSDPALTHLAYMNATRASGRDFLDRVLYLDAKTFLTELNLTYSDKTSMAASVEVRVPLLDQEVVSLMYRVPPNMKIRGATTKYLFRKAMRGIVPDEIIDRGKAGFGAPIRSWLRGELRPMIDDMLSDASLRTRGIFNPAAIRRMVDENNNATHDHTYKIWAFVTLEMWMRTFADRSVAVGAA
jgi:asparagine synthase (glutamine-hydrolysing)